jgi:cytochrome c556
VTEQPVRYTADTITDNALDQLYARIEQAETKAAAMTAAMESTATDALKHRGCHRDLMGQCMRAERAEAALEQAELDAEQQQRHFRTLSNERESYRQGWKYEQGRRARAEAAIARVRALHQPVQGLGYDSDEDDTPKSYGRIEQACNTCGTHGEYAIRWPCETTEALDEPKEPRP